MVLDPYGVRGSLAAVRALARAGWTVGVGGVDPAATAPSSRWSRWWDPVPPVPRGDDSFLMAVAEAVSRRGYEVVLPSGDAEALTLSRGRARIGARVPFPPHAVVARAFDKAELAAAADRAGLRTPVGIVVEPGVPAPSVPLPAVVKEALHLGGQDAGAARLEAQVADTQDQVAARVREIHDAGGVALVQEYVGGCLCALALVIAPDGTVAGAVQQEAERIFPAQVGASVRARTMPLDAHLEDRARAMLRELGWWGLCELQFLRPRRGDFRLIDFNGRLYGSLELAVAAGVNLPALWAAAGVGQALSRSQPARPGVRYQWLEGDVRLATHERGARMLRELGGCLSYALGARHPIWSASDPLPQIRDALRLVRQEGPNLHRLAQKLRPAPVDDRASAGAPAAGLTRRPP
jgi:predicted ATP-grasp superfamily ATP-dependent carboligase